MQTKVKQTIKTISIMAQGVIYFLVALFIIWSALNLDVLTKAIRYPEAVRQLKINVMVRPK